MTGRIKRIPIILAALFLLCVQTEASIRIRRPCGDHMVLQQKSEATIWGFASPGKTITVAPSWTDCTYSTLSDASGGWSVRVRTPEAGFTRYSIRVSGDSDSVTVSDVLIGEVWLASGQSNMQLPLKGWPGCPVMNGPGYIAAEADPDGIRMFNVPLEQSLEPAREVNGEWLLATPSGRADMSAAAYFFALELREHLGVPVGIINCAYGGTKLRCWGSAELVSSWGLPVDSETLAGIHEWSRQTACYNKMLSPCMGYTIKGFIWYQGCANVGVEQDYARHFAQVMDEWRRGWGLGELPVYAVEIAPYAYGDNISQLLRMEQWKSGDITPNCAVVPTNDLVAEYEYDNIHPSNKTGVGRRLAALALHRDYGYEFIPCYAPRVVEAFKEVPSEIKLRIAHAQNGFLRESDVRGLEVAGPDGVFIPVRNVSFDRKKSELLIRHDAVSNPQFVRYCWGDAVGGTLVGCDGLPLAPFSLEVR